MKTTAIEPLLRNATIKAIDGVAKKWNDAERSAESKVGRLLAYWNDLDDAAKEQAAGIAIATVTTAVTAIAALRKKKKSPVKKGLRKLVKKAL